MVSPSLQEPRPQAALAAMPTGSARTDWISGHRRALAVVGIVALALIALALGVRLSAIFLVGLVLLCPLMMLGMLGMHGSHVGQGGDHRPVSGANGASGQRALDILRERYARGEVTPEQYDRMRRDLS